jgi:hypothetical protein
MKETNHMMILEMILMRSKLYQKKKQDMKIPVEGFRSAHRESRGKGREAHQHKEDFRECKRRHKLPSCRRWNKLPLMGTRNRPKRQSCRGTNDRETFLSARGNETPRGENHGVNLL